MGDRSESLLIRRQVGADSSLLYAGQGQHIRDRNVIAGLGIPEKDHDDIAISPDHPVVDTPIGNPAGGPRGRLVSQVDLGSEVGIAALVRLIRKELITADRVALASVD